MDEQTKPKDCGPTFDVSVSGGITLISKVKTERIEATKVSSPPCQDVYTAEQASEAYQQAKQALNVIAESICSDGNDNCPNEEGVMPNQPAALNLCRPFWEHVSVNFKVIECGGERDLKACCLVCTITATGRCACQK